MKITIHLEIEHNIADIRLVNEAAFESDAEANLIVSLRNGGYAEVSLITKINGEVVGHILFSSLTLITETGTVTCYHSLRWQCLLNINAKVLEAS